MIKSKSDLEFYIKADAFARGVKLDFKSVIKRNLIYQDYIWVFQKSLRKMEYLINCKESVFLGKLRLILMTKRFRRISLKIGFSIPPNVFGPGLSIAHYGTIIVNGSCKIGSNCRLQANVNIGASGGNPQGPILGNNCYIGPGAKLYGAIEIGDNVVIGANGVVNKSFKTGNVAIAGVPAKELGHFNIEKVILYSKEAVEKRLSRDLKLSVEHMNARIKGKSFPISN